MNGRIYDPLLGRFLSADLLVQAPGNLQSYNRYSYVFNNPLTFYDPSGFAGLLPSAPNPWDRGEKQPDWIKNIEGTQEDIVKRLTYNQVLAKFIDGIKAKIAPSSEADSMENGSAPDQQSDDEGTDVALNNSGYTWNQFVYDFDDSIGLHGLKSNDPAHVICFCFFNGLRTIGATADLAMDAIGLSPGEKQGLALALMQPELSSVSFLRNSAAENAGSAFWSGRAGLNRAAAEASGLTTLESTAAGRALEAQDLFSKLPYKEAIKPWEALSEQFAWSTKGPVKAWTGGASPTSVWSRIELPTLLRNPEVRKITILDATQPWKTKIIYK